MGFHLGNDEQKITVNVSTYALNILDYDDNTFNPKKDYSKKSNQYSWIINSIIRFFYSESNTSISNVLAQKRDYYNKLFDNKNYKNKESIITTLLETQKDEACANIPTYDKDKSLKIRLQNENAELLTNCSDDYYYNNDISFFVKCLVEEYCLLPLIERESIICKDTLKTINDAITNKHQLYIKSATFSGFVRPYTIKSDVMNTKYYLIGIIDDPDKNVIEFLPISVNIVSIKSCKEYNSRSGFIKKDDQEKLDIQIKEKGAQFMHGELLNIKVKFTDEGLALYRRIIHLRPMVTSIDENDDHIYYFSCTSFNAQVYFSRFGMNAIILEPNEVKENISSFFNKANIAYSHS